MRWYCSSSDGRFLAAFSPANCQWTFEIVSGVLYRKFTFIQMKWAICYRFIGSRADRGRGMRYTCADTAQILAAFSPCNMKPAFSPLQIVSRYNFHISHSFQWNEHLQRHRFIGSRADEGGWDTPALILLRFWQPFPLQIVSIWFSYFAFIPMLKQLFDRFIRSRADRVRRMRYTARWGSGSLFPCKVPMDLWNCPYILVEKSKERMYIRVFQICTF